MQERGDMDIVLRELLKLLGPEGPMVLRNVVELYLEETPLTVKALGEALGRDDRSEAGRLAHRLKSSALSIGAARLAERCAEVEAACHVEQAQPFAAYASVQAEFVCTTQALREFLNTIPAT